MSTSERRLRIAVEQESLKHGIPENLFNSLRDIVIPIALHSYASRTNEFASFSIHDLSKIVPSTVSYFRKLHPGVKNIFDSMIPVITLAAIEFWEMPFDETVNPSLKMSLVKRDELKKKLRFETTGQMTEALLEFMRPPEKTAKPKYNSRQVTHPEEFQPKS